MFPNITVAGGVDMNGAELGLCLATNGEGSGSEIPGQLFLDGPRFGQCCFSSGWKKILLGLGLGFGRVWGWVLKKL